MLHVVLKKSCPLRWSRVVCVTGHTLFVHASCCSKNNVGFHFKHKSRSSGQRFFPPSQSLLHPLGISIFHAVILFSSVSHSYRTLFHVSIPLGLSVAYNICMYIICPRWRKRTKKRKKTSKKKKKHGQKNNILSCFSMWVWKKHVDVRVWVDFEKKKSKHCMLCSSLRVKGLDGGELGQ